MFLAAVALVVLLTVPLFGGSVKALAAVHLAGVWLIWVALAAQIGITEFPHSAGTGMLDVLHLATYAAAGLFLWLNRRLPGLWVLTLGTALNAVTIAANGGTLPASARAMTTAGIHPPSGFDNSGVIAHPHLAWLGDTMATPGWLPLRNVVSLGDLVIVAGLIVLVHGICRSLPSRVVADVITARRAAPGAHRQTRPKPGGMEPWQMPGAHRSSRNSAPTTV